MANIKIFVRNALARSGIVLLNGGVGPALVENVDWPMSHLLSPDRETYWRTSAVPPVTHAVEFDLGQDETIIAAGNGKLRGYNFNAATGLPLVPQWATLEYGTGSTYPPTWVAIFDDNSGPMSNNNNFLEFSSVVARFWRFSFTSASQPPFSCKLWLVRSADVIDLGYDWGVGTDESNERFRQVVSTPSGLSFAFEPGQERGTPLRSGSFKLPALNQTALDNLRNQLTGTDTRFVVKLGDGRYIETTLPEGRFSWRRRFAPPELSDIELELQEHA